MARMIDADRLLRELTALSHGQVWPGWTYDGIRLLIERQPTLTQPNEPLTLDEMRKMDGQPVWGKSLITNKPGEWFIVRVVEMSKTWFIACAGAEQGFGDKDTYGKTWLAYRRPPEGEEKYDA